MLGELYLQTEMPEPPKESFFRGLFGGLSGGGPKSVDREELCKYFRIEIFCSYSEKNTEMAKMANVPFRHHPPQLFGLFSHSQLDVEVIE